MFRVKSIGSLRLLAILVGFVLVAVAPVPASATAASNTVEDETAESDTPPIEAGTEAKPIRRHNAENNSTMLLGRPFLTAATTDAPAKTAAAFVADNVSEFGANNAAVATLAVRRDASSPSGGHFITVGQDIGGHPVLNAGVTVTLDGDGRIVSAGGRLVQPTVPRLRNVPIRPENAVQSAAANIKLDVPITLPAAKPENDAQAAKKLFVNTFAEVADPNPVTAEMSWLPTLDGSDLTLVWETDFEVDGTTWLRSLVVAAGAERGRVVAQENRYTHAEAEGTVFTGQHPEDSPARTIVPFSGLDGSWVDDRTTDGNNVIAYRDLDNDNTVGYQPQTPDAADPEYQHFNYAWTDAWRTAADGSAASLDADLDAAITQLFYYTNVMHDWAYGFGFDEPSGNFQEDNFGRGGSDSDRVLAEAQDGWNFGCADGTAPDPDRCQNNAFFATPADGFNPRMQMYMWAPGRPYREGSMDGDVIAHEYGHGISSRLVGGGNLNYGGHRVHSSLGEGWSDVISFLTWGDAVVGEYVTGNATTGIRRVAYDTSNQLYSTYNPNAGSGHPNGEIWASMVYDIRAVLGLNTTSQLVLDGMKATPGSPTYQDARDGIIAADTAAGGDNFCFLWSAFAARGLGLNSTFSFVSTSSPTDNFDIPAECEPSADAGGPYNTDEGVDVVLDGSASAAGTDPSAGSIVSYEWDFDDDGDFDDASGSSPTFDLVGQDGVYPVAVRVTDSFGNTDTDATTVTVDNVAPTVTVSPVAPINEGDTVGITGTVTDPGWLDPLTATVDWGVGDGPQALAGPLDNTRPDAELSFAADHTYGDNGVYTIEVCGSDDDVTVCVDQDLVVNNIDPTVGIDEDTYIAHADAVLSVSGTTTDPGSDDLTATWSWDDGTADTIEVSLVNPPAVDPAQSPTVQPRNVVWNADHIYAEACLYNLGLDVIDDDGGTDGDTAVVIITGNESQVRGSGWWKNQYRPKPPNHVSEERLLCYLAIVRHMSDVFDEVRGPLATRDDAVDVLSVKQNKGSAEEIFENHLLTAWLNFASGYYDLDTAVDTTGDGIDDATFQSVIQAAEAARNNPATTRDELLTQKDILEGLVE